MENVDGRLEAFAGGSDNALWHAAGITGGELEQLNTSYALHEQGFMTIALVIHIVCGRIEINLIEISPCTLNFSGGFHKKALSHK